MNRIQVILEDQQALQILTLSDQTSLKTFFVTKTEEEFKLHFYTWIWFQIFTVFSYQQVSKHEFA